MVTRRALFGAGAIALLAGCGPPEESEIEPSDVLREQVRAEQAVVAAYEALPDERPWRLAAAARDRLSLVEAALRAEGGTAGAPLDPPAQPGLEAVLAAERHALRVHVKAVGQLRDPKWSALQGELVAGSAAHETVLLELLERPLRLPSAFPGQPV